PISVFMLDIDKFKNYNDTYGHPQGDNALKAVAEALSKELKRSTDFAARWGGEEFIGLLPAIDSCHAFGVAEQLRKNIAALIIPADNGIETTVTVSVGINTVIPTAEANIGDFIKKADEALYRAKEAGRNRVIVS
ncbi:MAG: GGDEF domain-containing protein, partial [Firmicutes bacterium]|nr:GGDEF domain-containing protein [Bacillota bacterium]